MFEARYSDGRTAARHDIHVVILDDALLLRTRAGDPIARWVLAELVLLDEPVPGTLRLG